MLNESVTRLPWRLDKRVLPQHTDHGGVMWHGAYVGWLEEARVEALSATGYPYEKMASGGLEMPVVQLQIRYREALMLGDEVELMSVSCAPRGVRWPWSTQFIKAGVCVAEASVELALVSVRPVRKVLRHPPEAVAAAFRALAEGPKCKG
ncbi:thioesterase superfamily protein [Synechococcus sp. BIOS-E4-1]|uniref:acyl-CoA thioesterase n=1 Tax=Synechococcus sp. BIOS-E4-1 TaxID=1400864 RepID=UPI001644F05C|nr:acyl-CoA thioesterase [Synechococcus sp. BIOS-E4-1]QNI53197.1 thioesterase superfamily protein [Synechococcus sp. BIOS-E4-1]